MERSFFEDEIFTKETHHADELLPGDYEHCEFVQLDLSGKDLSGFHFAECIFRDCNLAMAKLQHTVFNGVKFTGSKLTGLHFEDCGKVLFSVGFSHCQLDMSSFFELKMKKTDFADCSLRETDFTGADLTVARFGQCDCTRAVFEHTILEKADFTTAFNYTIDPERNRVRKAKFGKEGLSGLLYKYDLDIR